MHSLTLNEVSTRVSNLAKQVYKRFPDCLDLLVYTSPTHPQVALAVVAALKERIHVTFVDKAIDADVVIQNVIHSVDHAATYTVPFFSLVDLRTGLEFNGTAPSFPWDQRVTLHSGFMAIETPKGLLYHRDTWRHAKPLLIEPTRKRAEEALKALRNEVPLLSEKNSKCYSVQHFVKVGNVLYKMNATPIELESYKINLGPHVSYYENGKVPNEARKP